VSVETFRKRKNSVHEIGESDDVGDSLDDRDIIIMITMDSRASHHNQVKNHESRCQVVEDGLICRRNIDVTARGDEHHPLFKIDVVFYHGTLCNDSSCVSVVDVGFCSCHR